MSNTLASKLLKIPSLNLFKKSSTTYSREIKFLFWATIILTVSPYLIQKAGIMDFSSHSQIFPYESIHVMTEDEILNAHFYTLSGAFHHAILDSVAFSVAYLTAILAIIHFLITRSYITPIIGIVLLMSGSIDVFHTFAAELLIDTDHPNINLAPFSWAICRAFNAFILIIGICLILSGSRKIKGLTFVQIFTLSLFCVAIASNIIAYSVILEKIPQTMFPNNIITRPWDLISLILFLIAGLIVFPIFQKHNPCIFSTAIWISVIPQMVTQVHMVFGSTELYDYHFNIAHILKIIAYLVIGAGLILDYMDTYKHKLKTTKVVNKNKIKEKSLNERLVKINGQVLNDADKARSEKKQAEALFEFSPDPIIIVDDKNQITLVNTRTEEVFGYSREELLGKSIKLLIPRKIITTQVDNLNQHQKNKEVKFTYKRQELIAHHKDGHKFSVEVSNNPLIIKKKKLIIATIRDITKRKQLESSLKLAAQLDPKTSL